MMQPESIARAALAMLTLPADVNFLEAIVLPRDQVYLGRG
jgi:NADP-dependent 3-hydroxy acid dehydrogenase YdfG